jgi:glycosyltransferase involved in cell wall biosynthesis
VSSAPIVVARVVTRLNVGGPTRHVAALMTGLDARAFRQTLFHGVAAADEGEGLLESPGEKVLVPALRRAPHPWRDFVAYRFLRDAFLRLRPDVVHTHQGKAGAVGRFAARAAGVPVVVHTHHGLVFEGYFSGLGRAAYLALERAAARRSDALVAQAPAQAEDLLRVLGSAAAGRIALIPPGVDVARFRVAAAPRDPSRGGERIVVVPARLEAVKDPRLALATLRRLPPNFSMRFFGDGALRAALAAEIAADPALLGRAAIHAPVADVGPVYAAADVVLLTSRSEGTPLALVEAQATGTPVVATDVGAARSVIAEGGGEVAPRDPVALAEAVARRAEARVPSSAVDELERRFGASRLCADVAALYGRLLSAGRTGASRR